MTDHDKRMPKSSAEQYREAKKIIDDVKEAIAMKIREIEHSWPEFESEESLFPETNKYFKSMEQKTNN